MKRTRHAVLTATALALCLAATPGLAVDCSVDEHIKVTLAFKKELRKEIVARYDPKNHFNLKTNTSFGAGTELFITLTTLDGRGANHEMEVTVGGRRAQRVASDILRFSVPTDGMQKDANNGVKLEIRVLR